MTRILFILKRREADWGEYSTILSSGLRNSVSFVVRMLESMGVEAQAVEVIDNNCIDREVMAFKPTHVIIEAFWVVPEKFDVLKSLHPNVHWIVRNHSETPFLANEGIAFGWVLGYLQRGVEIMCNAPRAVADMIEIARAANLNERLISYGPNYYPIDEAGRRPQRPLPRSPDVISVGCFGAIRPLKNHLAQAVAAISLARALRMSLRFHINGTRVEDGEPIAKNLRSLFAGCPTCELVEHPWLDHEAFLDVLSGMDIALQVSFSETFNIVAADAATVGVPLVVSKELPWIGPYATANPNSVESIVERMMAVAVDPKLHVRTANQRRDLALYCERTRGIWCERFRIPRC